MRLKKLIMFLFIISCLICSSYSNTKKDLLKRQLINLDKQQLEILVKSFVYGEKENFAYELTVIAWKESFFGRYPINLEDGKYGSFGPYHVLLEHSMRRNKTRGTWEKSRLAERLILDVAFSASDALIILKDFYIRTVKLDNRIYKTLAMYNAGVKGYKSNAGIRYAEDGILRIKVLKEWMAENDIENKLIVPARRIMNSDNKTKIRMGLDKLRIPIFKR